MQQLSAIVPRGQCNQAANETALVVAARAEPAAFGLVYEHFRDRVYAYMRARTANDEDAADLTQQVFLQALKNFPRFHGGGEFAAKRTSSLR